jgi:EAL domain-containing protein (putative c-di-GMP-specific phosphodiesterase class I)
VNRFWYLHRLLLLALGLALVLSLLLAALVAWRSSHNSIELSAKRAVLNAERMIERTASGLQKLDALRLGDCNAATIEKLKDSVYNSISQIREIGLIQNRTLFCTNFGPTNVDVTSQPQVLKVGTNIAIGPNMVVANNTSLFIYESREDGSAINAVVNPAVLAEYERGFSLGGKGQIEMRFTGPSVTRAPGVTSDMVYEIGRSDLKASAVPTFFGSYTSTRFPLMAEVQAERGIFWDEYWPVALRFVGSLSAIFLIAAFVLNLWLTGGGLNRSRYLQALRQNQFKVYYQPVVSAQTRHLVGVEALLRWEHPKHGLLRAAQFSDLFQDEELDQPITRFVLSTVAKDMKELPRFASHMWCSVNIAPALMEVPGMANEVVKYIKELPRNRLRLEITERTPISEATDATLRELRAQGIRMGLDDIGTGYSNLNQLQTMSYDFIKIDGLLVRSIQTVEGVSPVLDSLIQLALKLKTEIVAEGVETVIQANALSKRGVTNLQGYLFGPAKPFKDILLTIEYEQSLGLRSVQL